MYDLSTGYMMRASGSRWSAVGVMKTRAPSTEIELTEATHGRSVIEANWGIASASWAMRCSRSSMPAISTPGAPWRPNNVGAASSSRTISVASTVVRGGTR